MVAVVVMAAGAFVVMAMVLMRVTALVRMVMVVMVVSAADRAGAASSFSGLSFWVRLRRTAPAYWIWFS